MIVALGASAPPDYVNALTVTLKKTAVSSGYDPHITLLSTGKEVEFHADEDEIYFLDVDLSGTDGMTTAKNLRAMQLENEIVFLASDLKRVLSAFDVDALHYIIYNATPQRKIEEICKKAITRTLQRRRRLLKLKCAGEYRVFDIEQIKYFEIFDHIMRVYYNDTFFECYSTLNKMEDALNGYGFIRTHKSYYVALRFIQSIVSKEITMQDGRHLPIGRNKYAEVKEAWLAMMTQYDMSKGGGDD